MSVSPWRTCITVVLKETTPPNSFLIREMYGIKFISPALILLSGLTEH